MNLREFQRACERTMTNETSPRERMLNAALGLCDEAGEMQGISGVALIEEAGDLLWYVCQMCKALDTNIADLPSYNWDHWIVAKASASHELMNHTSLIAGMIKKQIFHKRQTSVVMVCEALEIVVILVRVILVENGATLEQAMEHNVAKLLKRFPDGFTYAAANARADKEEEKKVTEEQQFERDAARAYFDYISKQPPLGEEVRAYYEQACALRTEYDAARAANEEKADVLE